MSKFDKTRVSAESGCFVKVFPDKESYLAELNALKGLTEVGIAPAVLSHDNRAREIRIEHAGITLRSARIDLDHIFSVPQILRVAEGLFKCLSKLHAAKFCHYDVKEDNICIQTSGTDLQCLDLASELTVKLIDFGLSFQIDSIPERYVDNTRLGTPVCRSPEHIQGRPHFGQKADVFCAAATLVQLIDDSSEAFPPSLGDTDRQIKTAQEKVDPNYLLKAASGETVPKNFQVLLHRMFHPDPEQRPSSEHCYDQFHLMAKIGPGTKRS
jgi:serine/threonine protein kinase